MESGYYLIEVVKKEVYKDMLIRDYSNQMTENYRNHLLSKNSHLFGKKFRIHRKPLAYKKDTLVNVLENGNLVPGRIIKWYLEDFKAMKKYPEYYL